MKRIITLALSAAVALGAMAQTSTVYEPVKFSHNWSLGADGGVVTPLKHHAFFGDMRGIMGLHLDKQVSPVVAVGIEATLGVNTTSWLENNAAVRAAGYDPTGRSSASLDQFYVGAYTSVNLMNLFGGYPCHRRLFDIDLAAGCGWGRQDVLHQNYFVTNAGLNFNFNLSQWFTLSLKPRVGFNMTGTEYAPMTVKATSAAYNKEAAQFSFMAGFTYHFGPGFRCASLGNQEEIDALNAEINALRAAIEAAGANVVAGSNELQALSTELEACMTRNATVVERVTDNLQSVRYVFYKIGSSVITPDQMPNVEMVASFLKNHPESTVSVKGYASKDGPLDLNIKLAAARAESVKTALVKKYGIAADRIKAEGCGVGEMFSENDWNRVSICVLE